MENESVIEVITLVTYIFFIYLLLATIIERLSEVVVAVYKYVEFKFGWREYWNKKARKMQKRLDDLYRLQEEGAGNAVHTFSWLLWTVVTEPKYPGGRERISARLVRQHSIQLGTRIFSVLVAFLLVFSLQVDLFQMAGTLLQGVDLGTFFTENPLVGKLLSGAAISIGTEPLHHTITRIERWSERRASEEKGRTN